MVKKQGFTLIELLVVIAIIGILSSVVLASLNTARTRGKDAAAKAALSGLRAEIEIFADGSEYTGACAEPSVDRILANAESNSVDSDVDADCYAGASGWAASVEISEGDFCVDGTGFSGFGTVDTTDANAPVCAPTP